jgi:hypothetical protein
MDTCLITCPGFRHSTGWGAYGKFPATWAYAKVGIPGFLRQPGILQLLFPWHSMDKIQSYEVFI